MGIYHIRSTGIQHANTALLSKWVIQVMKPSNDMVSILLRESYEHPLDWSMWATPRRGDSPVVAGLRGIFSLVWSFFRQRWGMGHISNFGRMGHLGDVFPLLYAPAPNPAATILTMWTGTWTPSLPQALSGQRLANFMSLQTHLANLRPYAETQDTWLWSHSRLSAKAAYCLLRGQAP